MKFYNIKFANENFEISPFGAIFWPNEEILIVSDLHLEKGSSYYQRGTFLPPYDTFDTINRLEEIIKQTYPKKVLLLGDTMHDKNGLLRMPNKMKEKFFSLLEKWSFVLISGNHDEEFKGYDLKLFPSFKIGKITFRHQSSFDETTEISGHFHPVINTKFKGVRIRTPCFLVTENKIILPSFGTFTGGLDIKNDAFKDIISKNTSAYIIYNKQNINLNSNYF